MDRRITEGVRHSVDIALVKVNIILAVMMIIFSVSEIYIYMVSDTLKITFLIGNVALIICSLLIILDRDRNLLRTTGLMAVGIGMYRIFSHISSVHPHDLNSLPPLIIVILGINLVYSGTRYIKGVSRGRVTMIASMIGMIAMMSFVFIILMMIGMPFIDCIKQMPNIFAMIVLYVMFIGVLDSEPLRSHDIMEIQNRALDGMRRTITQYPGTGVYEDEAEILIRTFTDRSSWTIVDDDGPVECEHIFKVGDGKEWAYVTMQKWKGSDKIHMTVSDHDRGTLIQAFRFDADSLFIDGEGVEDSNQITFVGSKGCHSIAIRHISESDREEELYVIG